MEKSFFVIIDWLPRLKHLFQLSLFTHSTWTNIFSASSLFQYASSLIPHMLEAVELFPHQMHPEKLAVFHQHLLIPHPHKTTRVPNRLQCVPAGTPSHLRRCTQCCSSERSGQSGRPSQRQSRWTQTRRSRQAVWPGGHGRESAPHLAGASSLPSAQSAEPSQTSRGRRQRVPPSQERSAARPAR